jgi:hypothetical protein
MSQQVTFPEHLVSPICGPISSAFSGSMGRKSLTGKWPVRNAIKGE